MKPATIERLRHLIRIVNDRIVIGADEGAIELLCMEHGARCEARYGTPEFRMAGVVGSATSGIPQQLLASWLRAATRKLERVGQ
jgi:hypothetical protein